MKLQKILFYAAAVALCTAPFSNTNADIVACNDVTINPDLQSLFEQNSCNICEVSDADILTTYEDGLHSAEINQLDVRWKNDLGPSAKVCADLDQKTEEEQEECKADQLIYENDQLDTQIISNYDHSFDPADQNEFWSYGEDILWLPYDGQNEFYLNP